LTFLVVQEKKKHWKIFNGYSNNCWGSAGSEYNVEKAASHTISQRTLSVRCDIVNNHVCLQCSIIS